MAASVRAMLAADVDRAARLKGSFKLRSGQVSDEYFDKYRFEADPALLARVASAMLRLVPAETEVLAGLELGGVPIATAMSLQSGKPAAFVRKEAKAYGACLAVEGGSVAGRKVVMIEDVITTGGAVRDAHRLLEDAGALVLGVVCAIWRGAGDPRIEGLDVPVLAALTRDDLEAARAA